MLAKRVIPCLDVDRGRVVKGTNFVNLRDAGDPVEVAARYEQEGADELVFLDITASHEGRDIILDVVRRTAEQVFMPLTVGGGIRTLEDIRALLNAGSDKVSINSAACRDPEFVQPGGPAVRQPVHRGEHRSRSGSQKDGREVWEVHINGGRIGTGLEAVAWAREVERLGAGEIVLTSMDADGTKDGYDLEITAAVSRGGVDSGRGQRRGRLPGAPGRRDPDTAGPTRPWRPAFFISASIRFEETKADHGRRGDSRAAGG